jgi:hypothetical protein
LWAIDYRATGDRAAWMELIRHGSDASFLQCVMEAPRAVVFLTVPWSSPEREARHVFQEAVRSISDEYRHLRVQFFTVDEDAAQPWLATLGVPQIGGGYSLGVGSILWLEKGKVVSFLVGGCHLEDEIVNRSLSFWNDAT